MPRCGLRTKSVRHNRIAAPDFGKPLLFTGKLVVTAACFWYVLHQINQSDRGYDFSAFDFRWAALGLTLAIAQFPLLALRWFAILQALKLQPERLAYVPALAVTTSCAFFAQIVPGVVGEGIRIWMLTRFGYRWRDGLTSVLIDRGTGVGVLIVFTLIILLMPSSLAAMPGYHDGIVVMFGVALVVGVLALLLTPRIAPYLKRWEYSSWIGSFALDAHGVFLGSYSIMILGVSCLIHVCTIITIWCVGRTLGVLLPPLDWAVLFTVMVGVALVPISIGGWGLRELAVVSLLGANGISPEKALLLSIGFGFVFVVSALPGAIVWLFFSLPPETSDTPRSG